mgnify:CR=1 FL=1
MLRVRADPAVPPAPPGEFTPPPSAPLVDDRAGRVVGPAKFRAVVSARPEESAALADRLGRFGTDVAGVTLGGIPLTDLPLGKLRGRIPVSETDPRLFTGCLLYTS